MRNPFTALVVVSVLATVWLLSGVVTRPRRSRPNVILVSIDTLRADHLGAYGYTRATSPFIDSVAARGALFDDVVAPMPATDPSHAAMLTGLHPMRTGLLANALPLRPEFPTIAAVFRKAGYQTAAVTAVYHLSRRYGFDQGFERFSDVALDSDIRRSADAVNADVRRVIDGYTATRDKRPLFLFVHYYDVHAPYMEQKNSQGHGPGTATSAVIDELTRAYDSGIRYVDEHVREIWSALRQAHLADDTVIAITADHGEQLGEHGFTGGHADLYRETIRVPLIMAGPGVKKGRIHDTVSLMDLAPSLLDLAGLHFDGATDGRSLLPELRGEKVHRKPRGLLVLGYPTYARSLAWRAGPFYYIRNLEAVYRSLSVGPIPHSGGVLPSGMRKAEWRDDGLRREFAIPAVDFQPYRIVVDIAATDGCAADAVVSIPPGVDLSGHLKIAGPTRLQYSVARFDSSFVTITPGSCVDSVTWGFQKLPRSLALPASVGEWGPSVVTHLFETMPTLRKNKSTDELFDVRGDPEMTQDLNNTDSDVSTADELNDALEASFVGYHFVQGDSAPFSPEEVERLRSLGYIR